MRTALIAGASGLVGRACLRRLLDEPAYTSVVALARRGLTVVHSKLRVEIVDVSRLASLDAPCDDAFCALGSTLAQAGSKEAFRAVDCDGVVAFADVAVRGGARQFVLVSSAGAGSPGTNFYLQVKRDAEAGVTARPFRAVHVLRPGLLLGARTEPRPAESLFQRVAPLLNVALVGPLRQYRAIPADAVGAAMVGAALEGIDGHRVLHYDDINRLSDT